MPRSKFASLFLSAVVAIAFAACATDSTQSENTGSMNLNLELADGITINEVDWRLSGNDMDMAGTIDTSAPGATASFEVFGLPPGDGYLVELSATDESGEVTCKGDAEFAVEVGVTTDVMVFLNCKRPTGLGGVRVNGKFNICAQLAKVVVSPLQTSVGNEIDLSAQGDDVEGDPIAYQWSASGGSIADPSAQDTTYTCEEVGEQIITITVSDDDGVYCMDDWAVPVTCVDGDGGMGGSGGSGGEAGAGGAGGEGGTGGGIDPCADVTCDDTGNECTAAECNPDTGQCEVSDLDGNQCTADGEPGTCDAGVCVPDAECSTAADCPDTGNECIDAVCEAGACGTSNNTNACDGGAGICDAGVCVPIAECSTGADCPDDGNECTDAVCEAGTCGTSNNTNACDGGAGTCDGQGNCVPNAEVVYEQNFNLLPIDGAVIGDGWLYFINVAAPVPYGYGGPAPNGPQICALVDDQGGPEQEPQQLSVYSDYNNLDHGNGYLIETNVFQEPFGFNNRIPASEVGKTYTFLFQAKAGNIGASTTANAFIKVLNPDAGFAETAADRQDTTSLPADWGGYSVSLTIDASWVGQILQYGFTTNATNYEPSGNFYDNVVLTTE